MNNIHKIKLCDFYKNYGRCNNGSNCNYAHGTKELKEFIKKSCNYGAKCINERCNFEHPNNWNPLNNKLVCLYYKNGKCKKGKECKFLHIDEYDILKNNEHEKQIQLNLNDNIDDHFPVLVQKLNTEKNNNLSYSDITQRKKKEYKLDLNINEDLDIIKTQIKEKSIYLYKLRNKKWDDYEDDDLENIRNTEKELNILKQTYKKIKYINKKDIFNEEDLNVNTLFNSNEKENGSTNKKLSIINDHDIFEIDKKNTIPKVSITFNGFNIDKSDVVITNKNENYKKDNILILIENMEDNYKIYLEKIKLNIDKSDIDYYLNIKLKTQLNKILYEIKLFKENYKDIQ